MKKYWTWIVAALLVCGIIALAVYDENDDESGVVTDESVVGNIKTLHEECMVLVDADYSDTSYVEDIKCYPDGRMDVETIRYGGGVSCTIRFVYERERLVRKECKFEGQAPASILYEYDDDGRLIGVKDSEHPLLIESYVYNDRDQKEWTYVLDGEKDSVLRSYQTEYNVNGKVAKEVMFGVEDVDQVLEVHLYEYDAKGNLVAERIENAADGVTEIEYDYEEFDENDSWTVCLKTEKNEQSMIAKHSRTTRKLTYY